MSIDRDTVFHQNEAIGRRGAGAGGRFVDFEGMEVHSLHIKADTVTLIAGMSIEGTYSYMYA